MQPQDHRERIGALERADVDVDRRMRRVELALFGDPDDRQKSRTAIVPTMERINVWLDVLCTVWKVLVAAVPAAGAFYAFGRQMGWW